ncbi:hypothetical protein K1W69_21375 [Hoeflea sp. WL0058]|uniref:Permease n=1 Tax=Flavimaribacter sediminis TaxID=2865987 RepID=A0AAE3D2F4_9HYPH|nr:hypothetical protein [Flavimaribacter sediminis]MBW8639759.1 hypothetical protein [Flavimaribacter sediminis]
MGFGFYILAAISLALLAVLAQRSPGKIPEVFRATGRQIRPLLIRLPVAVIAAGLLGALLPSSLIAELLGRDTGLIGMATATAIGALLPGGPFVSFPLALLVWQGGAGEPQMVALLTSWSILGLHRVMVYELPILGGRFVATRLLASWYLPPLVGLIALLVILSGAVGDTRDHIPDGPAVTEDVKPEPSS